MSTTLGTISGTTHQFCRGKVKGDGSCLYSSFRYVNSTWNTINNERVRSRVADYIRKNESLHLAVLESGTSCKTVEEYCTQIEKHNLWGGEPEVRALAMLSRTQIRLISRTKSDQGKYITNILNYGENEETFKERVYILYDEENKHYDPLYVINKDSSEQLTIFSRNDKLVDELLDEFIAINTTEQLFNLVVPTANKNLPNKRKLPDYANLSFGKIIEIGPSLPTCNSDVVNKLKKLAKGNIDETSDFDKLKSGNIIQPIPLLDDNNYHPMTIEEHLQKDFFGAEYVIEMTEQPTTDSPTISNEDHEERRMRFEVEPALKFRGRTPGDFKPTKPRNRDGEPSKARPPRYFADRNDKCVLILLIPKKYLSPNVEYRVEIYLITREINGCSYVQPYFKIQVDPTDIQIPDGNPIYYSFSMADLEEYSEGMKQLPFRLVIVQQTNPQLMQAQQPLQIFSSNTETGITETYTSHRTFKKAYHLHDLRFALTLFKRAPGETGFRQCDDMQYISQVSTEDKNYRKLKKSKK